LFLNTLNNINKIYNLIKKAYSVFNQTHKTLYNKHYIC